MKGVLGQLWQEGDSYARHGMDDGSAWASLSDNPELTVDYPQAAILVPCSVRTVKRLVKSGDLESFLAGKRKGRRIYVRSIASYREQRKGPNAR